jgi:hypothetical protein
MLDASKRGQMRKKGAYFAADLLVIARKLYNVLDMQLRVLRQRDGLLAIMGPHLAEQVVLVIGTSSSKSLIFIISVSIANARITILVLLIVILQGDMLRRYHLIGIRPLI